MATVRFLKTLFDGLFPNYFAMQGASSVSAAGISYTLSAWNVKDRHGEDAYCKAVRVSNASAGGNLVVHLVGDPDGENTTYDLIAGSNEGFVFDKIIETGTTITLTDCIFYV